MQTFRMSGGHLALVSSGREPRRTRPASGSVVKDTNPLLDAGREPSRPDPFFQILEALISELELAADRLERKAKVLRAEL